MAPVKGVRSPRSLQPDERMRVSAAPARIDRMPRLSIAAARRIALAAQGFGAPQPETVNLGHLRRTMRRLAVVQLDSVNVFSRSHYLPFFSRLGAYDRALLDRLTAHAPGRRKPELLEYWAHEASILSPEAYAQFGWRKRLVRDQAWGSIRRFPSEHPEALASIRSQIADRGPLRSSELGYERAPREQREMWDWHLGKTGAEYLFWAGEVAAARRINFERLYDLVERVAPPELLVERPAAESQLELVRLAARAQGIATEPDLRDYFRMSRAETAPAIAALVAAGELEPVEVSGWREPAYLHAEARRPRRIEASTLLTPFDNLVWFRPRTERLFDFHYRIEIYTPAEQRVHGYYVLPFLLGDELVARVDIKSDRKAGVLRAHRVGIEHGADPARVMAELEPAMERTAAWLGLGAVELPGTGPVLLGPR